MPRLAALLLASVLAAGLLAAAPASAREPRSYVALGDSFAAGPVIPVQEMTGCLRSTNNYAKHLASRLKYRLTDVTCSGAQTKHMTGWQGVSPEERLNGMGVPPQLEALSREPKPDLVTLQIGGNDIGYSGIARACVDSGLTRQECRHRFQDDRGDGGIDGNGVDDLRDRIVLTAPKVGAVIAAVRERAPDAKVLVLGYSGIFAIGKTASCPAMAMNEADALYLRGIHEALNAMIAEEADRHGARYVDVYTPSAGRTACDAPVIRWVEPAVPVNAAAPIHPNLTGMVKVAGIIEKTLADKDSSPLPL